MDLQGTVPIRTFGGREGRIRYCNDCKLGQLGKFLLEANDGNTNLEGVGLVAADDRPGGGGRGC